MTQTLDMTETLDAPSEKAQPQPLTPALLVRLEDEAGLEYADGIVEEKPVSRDSERVGAKVTILLGSADTATEVEIYGSGLGYRCFPDDPQRFRKPDVSLIRKERLQALEDGDVGIMPIPADLAVEVISPRDEGSALFAKVQEYLTAGFTLVWLVDPFTRTVHAYDRDGQVKFYRGQDTIKLESILPGFECSVAALFA